MQVARNKFNDVRQPVLADWSNHVDRDLVLNVLAVALVRDFASLDPARVAVRGVHDGFVLFFLVGRLDVVLIDDVQLGAGVVDVLVAHVAEFHIDVEAFSCGGVVGSDLVADGQVVLLG